MMYKNNARERKKIEQNCFSERKKNRENCLKMEKNIGNVVNQAISPTYAQFSHLF